VGVSDLPRAEALLAAAGFTRVERAEAEAPDAPPTLRVFDAENRSAEIASVLVDAGLQLTSLTPTREDLETYFLRLTGGAS